MKKPLHRLLHRVQTGGVVKTLSRSRLFHDACSRYGLVYFGSVDTHNDEYAMVRGMTVSAQHRDRHYCVGSVEGYEIILLERTDQLFFPYKQPESYRWTVVQIDLDNVYLPHLYLDAHQHQAAFYEAMFAKFPHMRKTDASLFADHDPKFSRTFTAYCSPQDIQTVLSILSHDVTAMLAHHSAHYDFECFEDKLLVYSSNRQPTRTVIDDLFRAGIWLAQQIEASQRRSHATPYDSAAPRI